MSNAPPATGRFHQPLAVGVAVALLGIFGAWFSAYQGGKSSGKASIQVQEAAFQHEAQVRKDDAQGIARIMIADFDGAARNLCDIGTRGSWFVSFVPLRSRVSQEDRRAIAEQLKSDAWQTVVLADVRLATWDAAQRGVVNKRVDPAGWGFKEIIDKAQKAR